MSDARPDGSPPGSALARWSTNLTFSTDDNGAEQLLDENGTQVMMQWERPWMVRCVDALKLTPECRVLEIGFGCAYSAERIQAAGPASHTIVECADSVLERLRPWAAARRGVQVVAGTWQERLPELGEFDAIFFDDFGMPGIAESAMLEGCPSAAYREVYAQARSHMDGFLQLVLRWHCRAGSRISGYAVRPIELQTPAGIEVEISHGRLPVRPPRHCHYYFDATAVVPLIRVTSHARAEPAQAQQAAAAISGPPDEAAGAARGGKRRRREDDGGAAAPGR
jgi:hypothetical protein